MKNILSLSAVALIILAFSSCSNDKSASGAKPAAPVADIEVQQGAIVFIDLDRILVEYDMANDLRSVVETRIQNIDAEVTRRRKNLENEINSFQEKYNKGLLTTSTAEVQSARLQQQQEEYYEYAQEKQNEINEEQVVMMNQIFEAIKTYLDAFNETAHYGMILTNQSNMPVISADKSLDITDTVLIGLNEEYIKEKNKN